MSLKLLYFKDRLESRDVLIKFWNVLKEDES